MAAEAMMPFAAIRPCGSRLVRENVQRDLERLKRICSQKTDPASYPNAKEIVAKIPVYSGKQLLPQILASEEMRQDIMDEFHRGILGPGVIIVKGMMDPDLCRRVNDISASLTPALKTSHHARTPKFTEQHALIDPESFAEYYSNPLIALASEAWLGTAYQITGQSNAIAVGAEQQEVHRDYHMAHWDKRVGEFPMATHIASQFLTLQLAIAHTDQPLSTGPTRFLVYSNQNPSGYLNVKRPEHLEWINTQMVQMPLEIGDAVFFNPATYHQPGNNESEEHRVMCLFQLNSCMSRAMEAKDSSAITRAIWPVIKRWGKEMRADSLEVIRNNESDLDSMQRYVNGTKTQRHPLEVEALIAAVAEGYTYPRNMTHPRQTESPADAVRQALKEDWSDEELRTRLDEIGVAHRP